MPIEVWSASYQMLTTTDYKRRYVLMVSRLVKLFTRTSDLSSAQFDADYLAEVNKCDNAIQKRDVKVHQKIQMWGKWCSLWFVLTTITRTATTGCPTSVFPNYYINGNGINSVTNRNKVFKKDPIEPTTDWAEFSSGACARVRQFISTYTSSAYS